jgi:hypothetical protein
MKGCWITITNLLMVVLLKITSWKKESVQKEIKIDKKYMRHA